MFTAGTTAGPSLAGVRSTQVSPASASAGAWARCAAAEVASKTMRASPAWARSQPIPSALASIPAFRARARPSESGSTPTMAVTSRTSERASLASRSVPMLPEPRIMQGTGAVGGAFMARSVPAGGTATKIVFRRPERNLLSALTLIIFCAGVENKHER
jgi:hypothetical protein